MTLPAKLTVASTFSIHPPRGGGQLRIFNLYRHIAERCPVDVVTLVGQDEMESRRVLLPGLVEVRVPKTAEHTAAEAALQQDAGVPVTDVAFPALHEMTPNFVRAIDASAEPGGVLVASHPYTLPALREAVCQAGLWYDSHNVEVDLKRGILRRNATGKRLLAATQQVEKACCDESELVMASCAEDGRRLQQLFRIPADRVAVVPNGVDTGSIRFTGPTERRLLRDRLRIRRPIAIFIGSWHEPNLRAVSRIVDLASITPSVSFAIVGSVGLAYKDDELPANVELFGVVDNEFKEALLAVATLALNPVSEGSGTNMKMLDYLAAGVPVVSSEVGTRGLELGLKNYVTIAALDQFADAVNEVVARPAPGASRRLRAARCHVEERFDWLEVARRLLVRLGEPVDSGRNLTMGGLS